MNKLKKIPIHGITDLPCVLELAGRPFATNGIDYQWPDEMVEAGFVSGELAQFLSGFFGKNSPETGLIESPDGQLVHVGAVMEAGNRRTFVIARLPKALKAKKSKAALRNLIKRRARDPAYLYHAQEQIWSPIFRRAVLHGIPNVNKNIIAICEGIRGGTAKQKDIDTIRHASSQVRAIIAAHRILDPAWEPDKSRSRYQKLHNQITRHAAILERIGIQRIYGRRFRPAVTSY
jgi:hypothetical protein